jgi:lysophospholipase L1-like esterase
MLRATVSSKTWAMTLAGFLALTAWGGDPQTSQADDTQGFARWEQAIAAFETQDKRNPPPQNAVLFVGSSSIRAWDLPKYFPKRQVINRGFGGSEIADSTHFAERIILKHKPRVVVLYAGDNDIARGKTVLQVHANYRAFVARIHKALPKTHILFIAIKPSIARAKLMGTMKQANKLIAADCQRDKQTTYIDIFAPMLDRERKPRRELFVKDGLHLSHAGYVLWTKQLISHLD